MYYRQLKDFFRQREQKAFWIFSYANIAGLFGGLFVGRFLADAIPWLPGPLLIPLAMLGGLSLTWQRQGRETYKVGWLHGRYIARRIFSSSSLTLHSAEHYRVEQTTIRPFSIAGRLAYSGEGHTQSSGRARVHISTKSIAKEVTQAAPSSQELHLVGAVPALPAVPDEVSEAGGRDGDTD